MIGKTVTHYRILQKLGEGGMGVVYQAEDTTLKRIVALKFLPSALLAGEEEKKRFVREAQAAAALNHSNIATVFAIDEWEGQAFIVLELVEGRSLDREIASGPLKLADTLEIATQICQGLQAAHEKGIVHRDIKSANIMVTEKGQVKILDFGLAKLKGVSRVTKEGTTVGTMGYMSPEQLRGESVDQRTDIWSTGVLLYEMISGRLPFSGDYEQAVTYQILNEQAEPLTAVRTGVPMELERIIVKSIAKDADERYQHMDEMLVDLRTLMKSRSGSAPRSQSAVLKPIPERMSRLSMAAPWGVAAAMTIVAAFVLWNSNRVPPPAFASYRFHIGLDSGSVLSTYRAGTTLGNVSLAISRDGRRCVYVVRARDNVRLLFRDLASLESTPLPGTENAEMPFFSPDGQWVGFASDGMIRKVSLQGGRPFDICSVNMFGGGDWGTDDTVTFSDMQNGCLWRVPAGGGTPLQVTFKDRHFENETVHLWPQTLNNERAILFTGHSYTGQGKVAVYSLETGKRRTLFEGGLNARYIPTGHIIYARRQDGAIYAVPFDVRKLEVMGPHVPVLTGVSLPSNSPQIAVSPSGVLMYAPNVTIDARVRLVWVDRTGKESAVPLTPGYYQGPRLSRDRNWLLYSSGEKQKALWVINLLDGTARPFTDNKGDAYWAAWAPDGRSIVYNMTLYADSTGAVDLYRKSAGGRDAPEQLTVSNLYHQPCCFTSDGKWLIFQRCPKDGRLDIYEMSLDTPRIVRPLVQTPGDDHYPSLSPDNRWLAYASDQSGRSEVYVQPYHAEGEPVRVSREGGTGPVWGPHGNELYFKELSGSGVYTVVVHTGKEVQFGIPKLLFGGSYASDLRWGRSYDIASDGLRFIMMKYKDPPPAEQFVVVTNWFDELKRKLAGPD